MPKNICINQKKRILELAEDNPTHKVAIIAGMMLFILERSTLCSYIALDGSIPHEPQLIMKKFSRKMKRGEEWSNGNSRARFFNAYRVYCNASAWQTKVTFEKEMDIINNKMVREDRQLLIILDNVSTHKLGKTYSNIRLEFMMPNTTPQIQPLDHFFPYMKSVFKKWLNSQHVENKFPEKMEKINNIISFHKDVKSELIVKCWEKGGLKEETSSEIPDINRGGRNRAIDYAVTGRRLE